MTANQIAYWSLMEGVRHNKEMEDISRQTNANVQTRNMNDYELGQLNTQINQRLADIKNQQLEIEREIAHAQSTNAYTGQLKLELDRKKLDLEKERNNLERSSQWIRREGNLLNYRSDIYRTDISRAINQDNINTDPKRAITQAIVGAVKHGPLDKQFSGIRSTITNTIIPGFSNFIKENDKRQAQYLKEQDEYWKSLPGKIWKVVKDQSANANRPDVLNKRRR